ncbi:TolC family protein [Polyangium mundeleinium]|uniref:TolC family protein n=1 Tax=Polyangium mundeleinium TaxID=2995306 RepID=A0ABT5EYM9_9BACT|nr:TolC family protein [Polyangium mundeleinium]MDC0746925.1 TolC family protein [Polyangium mundeleinium]
MTSSVSRFASSSSPRRALRALTACGLALLFGAPAAALAQPAPAPVRAEPAPAAPAAAPTPPPPATDRIAEALAPQSGGLTPDEAARLALRIRPSLRVKQAELRAAAARVDQALLNYLPRVTVAAGYTRLSRVENVLGAPSTAYVGTNLDPANPQVIPVQEGPLVSRPCPPPLSGNCVTDIAGTAITAVQAPAFSFPVLLNSYSLTASISVPISDYVLRISQGYAAASHAESAKKLEVEAEGLTVAADAKVAFYNWVRAKGSAVVATEAVAQAEAHLKDAQLTFSAGLISKADVLRLEAQVAAAQQVEADGNALASLAEEQIRVALALPVGKPLTIGVDVLHASVEPSTVQLAALQDEALARRLEIRALDETEHSLKKQVSLARAGYFPRIDGFAEGQYQNPNQRVFPQTDEFRFTWNAGVRLSWTINDTLTAIPTVTEAQSRVEQIAAQKEQLLQGLKLEVASAHAELKRAEANIDAADRGLAAAEEGLRVQNELFRAGRATGVALVDAEAEVTRARLRRVDARVGILVARTRLEHATGRDVEKATAAPR